MYAKKADKLLTEALALVTESTEFGLSRVLQQILD
jgi:hypothetical protein